MLVTPGGLQYEFAPFWRRVVAWIIDAFLLGAGGFVFMLLMNPIGLISIAIIVIVGLTYEIAFTASQWQGTPGKIQMGIRVMTINGNDIGLLRSIGRFLAKALPGIAASILISLVGILTHMGKKEANSIENIFYLMFFLIAYGMAAFTTQRRALHDYIAGTAVVLRSPLSKAYESELTGLEKYAPKTKSPAYNVSIGKVTAPQTPNSPPPNKSPESW